MKRGGKARGERSRRVVAALPSIFAGLFLTNPPSMQVEPGHYDAESQLYLSRRTGQPAFVNPSGDTNGVSPLDTTGSTCTITTMTGSRDNKDDHSDSVQDDFDN